MEPVTALIHYPANFKNHVNIPSDVGPLTFYSPNSQCAWRYKTMFIKEPETIEWLKLLNNQDVLYDVGANVGLYSVYPAIRAGVRVYAFEPGAANYFILCKNIELNSLSELISPYCFALGSEMKISDLYLSDPSPGGAQNSLDEPRNDRGELFKPKGKQGMLSVPIDALVHTYGMTHPTAMKIDVDGYEMYVLEGAKRVLKNETFKRMSIEADSSNKSLVERIDTSLKDAGLTKTGEHRSPNVAPNSPIHNFHYERI